MSINKHNFEAEWITEIYYGGTWYPIKPGSYEFFRDVGNKPAYYYLDPYSDDTVVVSEPIKGYKFKQPEEAQVIQLHDDL